MERRFINLDAATVRTEKRADGSEVIIGYGAVFFDGSEGSQFRLWDDFIERVMPEAFDNAVKRDDVRGLFNHDPSHLLGRTKSATMTLSVDKKGLRYEIEAPDTQTGRDVLASIKRGDLSGSSFSFTVDKATWLEEGDTMIRELRDVTLYDVGPVTFPAYEATTTGVRSKGDADEARAAFDAHLASRGKDFAFKAQARARAVEVEVAL